MTKIEKFDNKGTSIWSIPVLTLGGQINEFVYLIDNGDDWKVKRLKREEYKERAKIMGAKNITEELLDMIKVYNKYIRRIESADELREGEFLNERVISNKGGVDGTDDEEGKLTFTKYLTAVNSVGLDEVRIQLFDIIGRVLTQSPFYKLLYNNNTWYTADDIHHQLFLDADEILTCAYYEDVFKTVRIYYLVHFMHGSAITKKYFKLDKRDKLLYDFENGDVPVNLMYEMNSKGVLPCDLHMNGTLNDEEFYILMMIMYGYEATDIGNMLGCGKIKALLLTNEIKKKCTLYLNKEIEDGKNR